MSKLHGRGTLLVGNLIARLTSLKETFMKPFRSMNVFRISVLCLLVAVSLPIDVLGQGRGRRVGQDSNKKCEKFVNCHDARDGRWDGRGPQRNVSTTDRIFGRNRRNRRFDDDDDFRRNRRFRRFDDDDDFRHISRRERRARRLPGDDYYRGRRRF
jgi:hypothetical protein